MHPARPPGARGSGLVLAHLETGDLRLQLPLLLLHLPQLLHVLAQQRGLLRQLGGGLWALGCTGWVAGWRVACGSHGKR
jgi:hypothetical protein